ncbi:3-ketosphinganine reductase [Grosmannia clavigera kw1407]|uniref:3-dehydrosphinganine reductase n=1 Tax=Grosmannia clavigera (strain kw1407 / UAMH 11150) TaxID=655863 RepID=F0XUH2_GROCL|nr:3-ketosphinganine reductase [Grosmannia clavigera kw1407]EFW99031.1 3-ketosphinganine reductase [Grosmannia clavigera kw1407]
MPAFNTSIALTSAAVVGSSAIVGSAMGWWTKNQMPVEGKTVLLTGATEGMGRSVAKQLAAQGADVIVVARNVGRLAETVAELKTLAPSESQRFHHIAADVAEPNYAAAVIADALAWNGGRPIDVVWCVAGMSTPMLWAEEPQAVALGASRRNMDVNFWGAAEMAHAILREWLRPEAGPYAEPRHLVLTASVLAFFAVVGYAPYTPTKWALRGLADTLAQETLLYYDTNPVRVSVVFPGTILSPGLARENTTKPDVTLQLEKDDPQLSPDQVAAQAIRGLQRGHHFVTVSWLGDLMRWGTLGGAPRNSWLCDTLGAYLVAFVMFFVVWWIHGDIRAYARKHGHPATYAKKG